VKRRLFNLGSALSLLLLVATAALWMGSFWRELGVVYHPDPWLYEGRNGWLTIARSRFHFSAGSSNNLTIDDIFDQARDDIASSRSFWPATVSSHPSGSQCLSPNPTSCNG
jgi:hypothetical protein